MAKPVPKNTKLPSSKLLQRQATMSKDYFNALRLVWPMVGLLIPNILFKSSIIYYLSFWKLIFRTYNSEDKRNWTEASRRRYKCFKLLMLNLSVIKFHLLCTILCFFFKYKFIETCFIFMSGSVKSGRSKDKVDGQVWKWTVRKGLKWTVSESGGLEIQKLSVLRAQTELSLDIELQWLKWTVLRDGSGRSINYAAWSTRYRIIEVQPTVQTN